MEKCPLCFSPYRKPKLLPCLDSICFTCLDEYIIKNGYTSGFFKCPVCDLEMTVPDGGITQFPDNQHIKGDQAIEAIQDAQILCEICEEKNNATQRCIDCEQSFCKSCSRAHLRLNIAKTHTLVDVRGSEGMRYLTSVAYCNKHKAEELTFFCQTCLTPVCMRCRLTTHEDHTTEDFTDFASATRKELRMLLDEDKGHRFQMLNEIEELREYELVLKQTKVKVKKEIQSRRKLFHEAVDTICDDMMSKFKHEVSIELQRLAEDKNTLEQDMLNLSNKIATALQMVDFGSDVDVVRSKGAILGSLHMARKDVSLAMTGIKLNIEFSYQRQADSSIRYLLGRLSTDIIPPSYINVTEVSTFRVSETSDVINSICPSPDGKCWIACGWKSDIFLYDRGGQRSREKKVGRDVDCLAIDEDGNCYVSCREEQSVKRFDRNFRRRMATLRIEYPRGIATTNDCKLVICVNETTTYFEHEDIHVNKVLKLGPDGDESKELKNPALSFKYPIRVAVNINDDLCVSDNLKHAVLFLKPNGQLKSSYTATRNPSDIALVKTATPLMSAKTLRASTPWPRRVSNQEQDILFSDIPNSVLDQTRTPNNSPLTRKSSVKALAPISTDGSLVSSITIDSPTQGEVCYVQPAHIKALTGMTGGCDTASVSEVETAAEFRTPVQPFDPRGITCDKYGHVIVADYSSNLVHLLDKHGRFLFHLLTEADGIFGPTSVAVDSAGYLWVGGGNATIKIFKYIDMDARS